MNVKDPYEGPAFSLKNRMGRALWQVACLVLFRFSPRPFHGWRAFLLRRFGAQLGAHCHIYPGAKIWAPWNLVCEDHAAIADGVIVYNPSKVFLGSHSIVSQEAYLCGATHDYNSPEFPLISGPISIHAYAWVCARATVQANLTLGEGSILALGAVATRSLEPWTIYAGVPAKKIKSRVNVTLDSAQP